MQKRTLPSFLTTNSGSEIHSLLDSTTTPFVACLAYFIHLHVCLGPSAWFVLTGLHLVWGVVPNKFVCPVMPWLAQSTYHWMTELT